MNSGSVTILLLVVYVYYGNGTELKNCDLTSPVQLNLSKAPDQFYLRNGREMNISAGISINNFLLPDNFLFKIYISKKITFFWAKIPCTGCNFSLSCKEKPEICQFREMCKDCSMNVNNIKVQLPMNLEEKIPRFIPGFILNGKYWVKVDIMNGHNNERVGCVEVTLNLKR